jgi:capsule biosynthesis phosphatase
MKRLVIDLDGTITKDDASRQYNEKEPDIKVIDQMRAYREMGFEIIICTARNMATFGNSVGKINAHTLPVIIEWLNCHNVPYDEIHVGKPWCGHDGFYVDDRAIRPSEFVSLKLDEIHELIANKQISDPSVNQIPDGHAGGE